MKPTQATMFQTEDLPLFSGTAPTVTEAPFTQQAQPKQERMLSTAPEMKAATDYIWQTEVFGGTTPHMVAEQFAAHYWDRPRQIENVKRENDYMTFQVVDGSRTYAVVYVKAVSFVSPARYRIVVLD